jgi:hypothetical protein
VIGERCTNELLGDFGNFASASIMQSSPSSVLPALVGSEKKAFDSEVSKAAPLGLLETEAAGA